jgi:hypothetical protein
MIVPQILNVLTKIDRSVKNNHSVEQRLTPRIGILIQLERCSQAWGEGDHERNVLLPSMSTCKKLGTHVSIVR